MRIARDREGHLLLAVGPDLDRWVRAADLGVPADDLALGLSGLRSHLERLTGELPGATHDVVTPDLDAPVRRPGKILAVGLNYLGHIAEVGRERPTEPMVFAKYPSAVTGPADPIELDASMTTELDYETELAVVVGRPARRIAAEDALDHVLGYCVADDVSARDLQRAASQISLSKGMDTFCPLGPWITTADEIGDPGNLRVTTEVNGETRQDSTTADLLFDVAHLLAHLSLTTTLETGDVVLTGTPSGVGSGLNPPSYLKDGDIVRCEIERLGHLENKVIAVGAAR